MTSMRRRAALGPLTALVSERLRLLGQEQRLRLVIELESGERSVQQLADALGATQQNVSKHLGLLQRERIVRRRPEGSRVWYSLADLEAVEIVEAATRDVLGQLRSLGELIRSDGAESPADQDAGTRRSRATENDPPGASARGRTSRV